MKVNFKEVVTGVFNLVLMTVICTAAIAIVLSNLKLDGKTNSSINVSEPILRDVPDASEGKRTQDNPLFAQTASWTEDFNSSKTSKINSKYWNVLVGPAQNSNKEQQNYTSELSNIIVKDGLLQITANYNQQAEGLKYTSARIESMNKKEFLYGRLDVVAKLPSGAGTWPAIWMLPGNDLYASKSPASNILRYKNGGEIDIMEAVGSKPNLIYGVAHTSSDLTKRKDGTGSHGAVTVPNSQTNYNKYTLLWTPDKLVYEVNGVEFYSYKKPVHADYTTWPYDQPFYLIINLAMGGTWGGIDKKNYPPYGINNKALPATFAIDSVDYYSYIGNN